MAVTVQVRSGAQATTVAFFMYFCYLLYSSKCNRYYIGYTGDMAARLKRHNSGGVAATKNCTPYEVKAVKEFSSKAEAQKEELRLKNFKSRIYLEWLIDGNWQARPD